MDYKEKYEMALERAKCLYSQHEFEWRDEDIEYIFPELKKSEDERIRQRFIKLVKMSSEVGGFALHKWEAEEMLSWLEKQVDKPKQASIWKHWKNGIAGNGEGKLIYLVKNGNTYSLNSCLGFECDYIELSELDNLMLEKQSEQKSIDKPKFRKGEWLCENEPNNYARFIQILEIVNVQGKERYRISRDIHNDIDVVEFDFVEKYYHKFDIKDARDGDVLLFEGYYNSIVLFQGIGINGKGRINYHCKCDLGNYSFGVQGDVACLGTIEKDAEHYHPATEEQRELLWQKIKEAGYMWDSDSKQLLSLKAEPNNEKKPAWSKEDEELFTKTLYFLDAGFNNFKVTEGIAECKSWVQSLKQRCTWKPSEEQLEALESATENCAYSEYQDCLRELIEQLKKL